MKTNRRDFLKATGSLGAGAGLLTMGSSCSKPSSPIDYETLDKAMREPVLKRDLFPQSITIRDLELLHYNGSYICRVRSQQGAEGYSVSNSMRMKYLYPIFEERIAPFFLGKDARDLEQLLDEVYRYRSNYKFQSYALWIPVATAEMAILDMLGRIAQKPMGALLGDIHHSDYKVHITLREREITPDESIKEIRELVAHSSVKAVKIKIGIRMGQNKEVVPNRSENLIPAVRKELGDEYWLGADANGGYSLDEGIRIGKILDEYKYDYYEEPLPFDWYHDLKTLADAVETPVAGGEQEGSMRNYRWMIANKALQIYRLDMFYFGGLIRCKRVARMADAAGFICAPHTSGSGLGFLYAMHFVSSIPNADVYNSNSRDSELIPFECSTSSLQVEGGTIKIPTGPGLGVEIDPDFLAKHRPVKLL